MEANAEQAASVKELLELIRSMVDDDDLSIHEFATLDRWLAANRHVAELWPANVITEGVHHVSEDNLVEQHELDAMCDLLKEIAAGQPESLRPDQ